MAVRKGRVVILVVSHPGDDHAVAVLDSLSRAGHAAALVDTSRFPQNACLTERFENGRCHFQFSIDDNQVDLSACRAGWWRRPQPMVVDPRMPPAAASFSLTECYEAFAGLWPAMNLTWVNPPHLDEVAHHKPYQLAIATEVGLRIPRTVITNDPTVARKFIEELAPRPCIYKTFLATENCWRETRLIQPGEVEILDAVRHAPVIFQEYIAARADVRVTVVGPQMFPAAITPAPGGYDVDYRMDMAGAVFQPTTLASKTQRAIRKLMHRLGLVYGAIDLRRTDDGDVFLEINPAGEWQFVEERTCLPITDSMAKLLAEFDHAQVLR